MIFHSIALLCGVYQLSANWLMKFEFVPLFLGVNVGAVNIFVDIYV